MDYEIQYRWMNELNMTLNEWLMNSCFSLGHSPTKKYYNIKGITQILGSASHVLWICLIGHTYSKKKREPIKDKRERSRSYNYKRPWRRQATVLSGLERKRWEMIKCKHVGLHVHVHCKLPMLSFETCLQDCTITKQSHFKAKHVCECSWWMTPPLTSGSG